jgi:uncharacterized membrane protein (UPF0127 family)
MDLFPPASRVVAATTVWGRLRGLGGRAAPPAGTAVHLAPCRSVHTFWMRFALDLVWLDGAGRPVRVDRAVPPRRVRSCRRARSVLEIPAGEADAFLSRSAPARPRPPPRQRSP